MVCRLPTCCGIFSESPGAEGTSLVKGVVLQHYPYDGHFEATCCWTLDAGVSGRPPLGTNCSPPALEEKLNDVSEYEPS
jgi:hypothetical protein